MKKSKNTSADREKFEETMKALFRVPKSTVTEKIKKKSKKGKN